MRQPSAGDAWLAWPVRPVRLLDKTRLMQIQACKHADIHNPLLGGCRDNPIIACACFFGMKIRWRWFNISDTYVKECHSFACSISVSVSEEDMNVDLGSELNLGEVDDYDPCDELSSFRL